MEPCPCGLGKEYTACCGLLIDQAQAPPTPEALMRSRYTAYVRLRLDYIARTMKSPAADHFHPQEALEWAREMHWQGLEVLASEVQGDWGQVDFKAHGVYRGQPLCLEERSEFRREGLQWYYVAGKTPAKPSPQKRASKIPRNALCPCGSQKKYKKCCG